MFQKWKIKKEFREGTEGKGNNAPSLHPGMSEGTGLFCIERRKLKTGFVISYTEDRTKMQLLFPGWICGPSLTILNNILIVCKMKIIPSLMRVKGDDTD